MCAKTAPRCPDRQVKYTQVTPVVIPYTGDQISFPSGPEVDIRPFRSYICHSSLDATDLLILDGLLAKQLLIS
jgi:hypothetical protein